MLAVLFGVREGNPSHPEPTADTSKIQTDAVSTFAANLTETARAYASPSPTSTALATLTAASGAGSPATPRCLGLHFVRDVTIPDNTELTPAEVFTKSWLVQNSGSCPWKPGFEVVLIGGVAMGGSPFRLAQTVGPGGSVQVSIKMAAPTNQTGVIQGTWKMSDDTGTVFGDYLSVVVVVSGDTPTPPLPRVTPTP
jgi:hypothetical protein